MNGLTKRQLFKGNFRTGQTIASGSSQNGKEQTVLPRDLESIAGDFPPELLALEAKRLGLDPDSPNREQVLMAIYKAMAETGGTGSSGQ